MRKIIASIDIGSNAIKIVVGEITKLKLNILAVSDTPSKGVKKGLIINPNLFINALKEGIKSLEDKLGIKINKAIVNVPSNNAEYAISEGTVNITSDDKLITGSDIQRVLQSSVYNKVPDNMELVTIMPITFKIDDEKIVKNPKNMFADNLKVKVVMATVPKKNVYSVLSCLEKAGIKVIDITFSVIGDYYQVRNDETEDDIGAIINIGAGKTEVSIFNKGVITNSEVVDLGGINIDNDLSFIYKLNQTDSHKLKENLALAHKRLASASEYETLTTKLGETLKLNQYEVSEIVMSRLSEILNLTKKQINLLTKKEISYIIITGGVTETTDFDLILEEVYGHNASTAKVYEMGVRDNKYSTAVGMIKYFNSRLILKDKEFSILSPEALEEISTVNKKINVNDNSLLGIVFGYFFDN